MIKFITSFIFSVAVCVYDLGDLDQKQQLSGIVSSINVFSGEVAYQEGSEVLFKIPESELLYHHKHLLQKLDKDEGKVDKVDVLIDISDSAMKEVFFKSDNVWLVDYGKLTDEKVDMLWRQGRITIYTEQKEVAALSIKNILKNELYLYLLQKELEDSEFSVNAEDLLKRRCDLLREKYNLKDNALQLSDDDMTKLIMFHEYQIKASKIEDLKKELIHYYASSTSSTLQASIINAFDILYHMNYEKFYTFDMKAFMAEINKLKAENFNDIFNILLQHICPDHDDQEILKQLRNEADEDHAKIHPETNMQMFARETHNQDNYVDAYILLNGNNDKFKNELAEELLQKLSNIFKDQKIQDLKEDMIDHILDNKVKIRNTDKANAVEKQYSTKIDAFIKYLQENKDVEGEKGVQILSTDNIKSYIDSSTSIRSILTAILKGVPVQPDYDLFHQDIVELSNIILDKIYPEIQKDLNQAYKEKFVEGFSSELKATEIIEQELAKIDGYLNSTEKLQNKIDFLKQFDDKEDMVEHLKSSSGVIMSDLLEFQKFIDDDWLSAYNQGVRLWQDFKNNIDTENELSYLRKAIDFEKMLILSIYLKMKKAGEYSGQTSDYDIRKALFMTPSGSIVHTLYYILE